MSFYNFLELVEIRTKLASVIPFSLGTLYAVYHFKSFDAKNFILLLVSLLAFDMVTTGLNNYFDYKRAIRKHGYNYETHNVIVRKNIPEATVITILVFLLAVAVLFGILLFFNTNIILLAIGMLSFAVGISYSFGPVPISRTPLGEMLSGLFMGFVILFLSVYVHIFDQKVLALAFRDPLLLVSINPAEILWIFLFSLPVVAGIANIMLAINICDMEGDLEDRRYTLPIYIGKDRALMVYRGLYGLALLDIILLAAIRLIPLICIASLAVFLQVNANVRLFDKKQTKKETFALAVKNFLLIGGSLVLLMGVQLVLNYFLS